MDQQFEAQRGFCQCTTKIHRRSRSVVGSAEAERFMTDCNVCEFSFGKNLSVRLVCAVLGFFAGSCRVGLTATAWGRARSCLASGLFGATKRHFAENDHTSHAVWGITNPYISRCLLNYDALHLTSVWRIPGARARGPAPGRRGRGVEF